MSVSTSQHATRGDRAASQARTGTGAPWRQRLRTVLKDTFHIARLRDAQRRVIEEIMAGHPTLAVMPTGAGKSLCYQLPAMLLPGRTLVVSPLIALMKDQCDKLRALGVNAVEMHSNLSSDELAQAEQAIADGTAKLIFVTPERLSEPAFIAQLKGHPVDLLVIDEAHCISQWGHDFRPAFLEVGSAARQLRHPTVLALTATATQEVIEDVIAELGVPGMGVINTGVYRPNLRFQVTQMTNEPDKLAATVAWVKSQRGSGLVYAATVKAVEEVHAALVEEGESATLYHGKLPASQRRDNQDRFMRGDARVMVATNAFGLGIDKLDTRFVLHHQLPGGLDAYYQEAGRAGRDGEPANCMLLHYHRDKAVQQFFLIGRYPSPDEVHALYAALLSSPPEEGQWTAKRLHEHLQRPAGKLHVALKLLRDQGVVAQDRKGKLRVLKADLKQAELDAMIASFDERRQRDREQLERMVFYAQTGFCRWKVLLEHYDEDESLEACGTCDNCERRARLADQAPEEVPAGEPAAPPSSPSSAFQPGQRVKVPRYGQGEVTAADAETVTLVFPNGKTRSFLADYAQPCN